ncbi:hypothetical protein NQ317_000965 [Molorchus minor]|uniref:DUF5641 domain-containing protein n=1 Tax=Molorchus minor TaxID=1323400 RepID=A0ABQ9IX20_9CUCU|nr:hypothetical protein NQ317_000965 [Molorchus minor]
MDGTPISTSVQIKAIICDAPALAFVKAVKSHGGYYCCTKCCIKGRNIKSAKGSNKIVFTNINAELRTDASFRSRKDFPGEDKIGHHMNKERSILERLPIDMIKTFPLDKMHLVDEGVVKKMIVGQTRPTKVECFSSCNKNFVKLYGSLHVTYNIHGLLHIAEDAKNLGPLDENSCYLYEAFIKTIKKMLHSFNRPLEQCSNRINEITQQIQQHFWNRWTKEYVCELQNRAKWKTSTGKLREGALVVIRDENLPPLKWNLGRIVHLHPGQDGIARVASVKTRGGVIRRSFAKLCPLPCNQ